MRILISKVKVLILELCADIHSHFHYRRQYGLFTKLLNARDSVLML